MVVYYENNLCNYCLKPIRHRLLNGLWDHMGTSEIWCDGGKTQATPSKLRLNNARIERTSTGWQVSGVMGGVSVKSPWNTLDEACAFVKNVGTGPEAKEDRISEIRMEITAGGRWKVSHKSFTTSTSPAFFPSFKDACEFVQALDGERPEVKDRQSQVTENYRQRALKAELKLNDIRSVLNRD